MSLFHSNPLPMGSYLTWNKSQNPSWEEPMRSPCLGCPAISLSLFILWLSPRPPTSFLAASPPHTPSSALRPGLWMFCTLCQGHFAQRSFWLPRPPQALHKGHVANQPSPTTYLLIQHSYFSPALVTTTCPSVYLSLIPKHKRLGAGACSLLLLDASPTLSTVPGIPCPFPINDSSPERQEEREVQVKGTLAVKAWSGGTGHGPSREPYMFPVPRAPPH